MTYRPEPKGSMKAYLDQRSIEERISEAAKITAQHLKAHEFIKEYRARGRKTAFNWSPTITVTKPEETTREVQIHHQEEAAEVCVEEGVGDAPQECREHEDVFELQSRTEIGSRFARAGHTDFGDGDTPF